DVRLVARFAVRHVPRDRELALSADLHARQTFVPALDDLALPDRELERLIAIARAVELLPVHQGARVVDLHLVALLGLGPGADDLVDDLELVRPGRQRRRLRRLEAPRRRFVDLLRAGER